MHLLLQRIGQAPTAVVPSLKYERSPRNETHVVSAALPGTSLHDEIILGNRHSLRFKYLALFRIEIRVRSGKSEAMRLQVGSRNPETFDNLTVTSLTF